MAPPISKSSKSLSLWVETIRFSSAIVVSDYMHQRSLLAMVFVWIQVTVVGLTFFNRHILIWNFRLIDFVDLVFLGPFFLFMFILMANSMEDPIPQKLRILSYIFFFLFFEGHSMHMTANAIDTFAFEVHDYAIPSDLRALIHFLDEILGHALFFMGLFGLFQLMLKCETPLSYMTNKTEKALLLSTGFLYGIGLTIAIIEATYFIWFYLIYCIVSLLFYFRLPIPFDRPYSTVIQIALATSIFFALLYW
ncbi:MAG: hypothetical protein D6732_06805, partial [Methanobacteriota archaeon]